MLKKETADDRVEKVVRLFSKLKNANLFLDIGCGNGGITCRIKDSINAKHTYGVDVAKSSLVSARERGIQPIMIDIDSCDLPFRDGSFEAIYCGEVIEHLRDTDHLLGEVHRVLAQDGICVLDTPNLASWHGRIELLLGYQSSVVLIGNRSRKSPITGYSRSELSASSCPFTGMKSRKRLELLTSIFDIRSA